MLAFALQGIGGMNSFAAGVLQQFRNQDFRPDLISATSGSIISAFLFLDQNQSAIQEFYQKYYESNQNGLPEEVNFLNHVLFGYPGVFKPIPPMEHFVDQLTSWNKKSLLNYLYPAKIYEPTRPEQFYQNVADRFNASTVGVMINAYNHKEDQAVLYVNQSALNKTELKLGQHKHYWVKKITADGVKASLQLLQYGDYQGEYDGAYQYNPVIEPLTVADEVLLVTVESIEKSLKPIENFFDVEDFKLKMLFKNAIYSQLNNIDLINKLIREKRLEDPKYKEIEVNIIQPTSYRGYFDYFIEDPSYFENGVRQAQHFLESRTGIF